MRAGLTIQERTCPWCQNKRTIRLCGELSICFNCNHHWRGASPLEKRARAPSGDEPLAGLTFGPLEVARLVVYRAAVESGYFTDWPKRRVA